MTTSRAKTQEINRPKTDHGKSALFKKGGDTVAKDMKKLFAGKETKKEEAAEKKAFPTKAGYKAAEAKYEGEKMARGGGIESKGKTKGKVVKMATGGVAASSMGKVVAGGNKGKGEHTVQKSGLSKGKMIVMKKGGKAC